MSFAAGTRFEVIRNGKRVCVSGINDNGVLNVIVGYVKHANSEPRYDLHIGPALGRFHPTLQQSQHVTWSTAEHIGLGDEITIRVLPAGDFDPPDGMRPHTSRSIDDPLFGHLDYNIDAWNGTVAFDSAPFESAHVHLVASDAGPLESQRTRFQEFRSRHPDLWPTIADALIRCHAEIDSYEEFVDRIHSQFAINMYDDSNSIEIVYSVRSDPHGVAYLVMIRDWEVAEISSVR